MSSDMMQHNATLLGLPSVPQEKVLAALLSGSCVSTAAKAGEVDRATVHRWLSDDPAFIAAYNAFRREMVDAVRQEVRYLAADAVKALRSVLTDQATPPALRLRAAGEVLKLVMDEKLTGPTTVEDAEVALNAREMDRLCKRRPARLV